MSTDPVAFLLRAAINLGRPAIEQLTEALIAEMDARDGDTDVEDDDPAGDPTELNLNPRFVPLRHPDPRMVWFKPE